MLTAETTRASRSFRAMGSQVHLWVAGRDAEGILSELEQLVVDREHCWSRFDPQAELFRLNRRPGSFTQVSTTLYDALDVAQAGGLITRGAFTPLVGQAMGDLGYGATWLSLDLASPRSNTPTPVPGLDQLVLYPESKLVYLGAGCSLDLGGVGKGLAADAAVQLAESLGADAVSASVGGDVACASFRPDVATPRLAIDGMTGRLAEVAFDGRGAVATSAPMVRSFADGRHHIIDPTTGASATHVPTNSPTNSPTNRLVSASVLARTCALAEMVATALCVLPIGQGLALAAELDVACVCQSATGAITTQSSTAHPVLAP